MLQCYESQSHDLASQASVTGVELLPLQILIIVEELTREERLLVADYPAGQCVVSATRLAKKLTSRGITVNRIQAHVIIDIIKTKNNIGNKIGSSLASHSFNLLADYNMLIDCTGDQFNQSILKEEEHIPPILIANVEDAWRYIFNPLINTTEIHKGCEQNDRK